MTPITDAERLTGQFHAVALLGELLGRAVRENLPPITWRIDTTGQMKGQAYAGSGRREVYTRWRDALGSPDGEREDYGRVTAVWESKGRVRVVLTADVRDDEPAGEEGSKS